MDIPLPVINYWRKAPPTRGSALFLWSEHFMWLNGRMAEECVFFIQLFAKVGIFFDEFPHQHPTPRSMCPAEQCRTTFPGSAVAYETYLRTFFFPVLSARESNVLFNCEDAEAARTCRLHLVMISICRRLPRGPSIFRFFMIIEFHVLRQIDSTNGSECKYFISLRRRRNSAR